jgi:hypothetical protein
MALTKRNIELETLLMRRLFSFTAAEKAITKVYFYG